jgi:hypothetical protein
MEETSSFKEKYQILYLFYGGQLRVKIIGINSCIGFNTTTLV